MKSTKITAVIMAGGKGTRLHTYTLVLPKPLMPVGGGQPVIEILLMMWLRRSGIEKCYITTGYLGHLIRVLCGDGSQTGNGHGLQFGTATIRNYRCFAAVEEQSG